MEPNDQDNQQEQKKPAKGYGKRPLWQWIVLYVIVAAIVYFLIYLLFFHHSSSSGGGSGY